jgi:toxin ParE1/3/4
MSPRNRSIRLLHIAEDDLSEIISLIAADNVDAAAAFLETIEATLSRLEQHPLLGRIPGEEDLARMGYRYLVVGNYLVFYTLGSDTVLVHRIIHGARDYLALLH